MDRLIKLIIQILMAEKSKQIGEEIARLAEARLGTDFTDDNKVPDIVSCAFATTTVINLQDPTIPIMPSTAQTYRYMVKSPKFEKVTDMKRGDIVVYPTGYNYKVPFLPNGHIFIALDDTRLVSNDSATGLFKQNYTRETARDFYYRKGGLMGWIFRKVL